MTTGQIIDFSIGKVNDKSLSTNQISYQYKRISAMGNVDTVQLNLTDKTLSNLDYQTQLDCLNKMKNTATESSGYLHTGRIISSITNETLPLKQEYQYNHQDETYIQTELDSSELEADNPTQDNNLIYSGINIAQPTRGIIDITEEQNQMRRRFDEIKFTHTDEACIDLFHIMKTSNVPLVMFDRIIRWLKRHEGNIATYGTSGLLNRNNFLDNMNKKLYSKSASLMKPKLQPTVLSSGRTSNIVIFSMKEMILRMITNKSLLHPDNLLLDPTNLSGDIPDDGFYGDVNSGTWFAEAKMRECSLPNHILMPFCHFIDGLSVDKYGKVSVEAVLSCCLWYNRKARNRSSSWFVQGFIEDQKLLEIKKTMLEMRQATRLP